MIDAIVYSILQVSSHFIPLSFQNLVPSRNSNKNGNETFRSNVTKECLDPYITFARNIPHVNH